METLHSDDPLLAHSLPDYTLGFYITLIPCTLFCHDLGYIPSVFLFLKIKIRNGSCCHAIFAQNPASNSLPSSTAGKATHKSLPLEKGESKYILKEVIVS